MLQLPQYLASVLRSCYKQSGNGIAWGPADPPLLSERRGGIATAPPLRRSYSDRAVTSPGGGALFKPIPIWPITDTVLGCSLTASDVVDDGAD